MIIGVYMSRKIPTEKEIYDGSVHHANNSEIGFLGTIESIICDQAHVVFSYDSRPLSADKHLSVIKLRSVGYPLILRSCPGLFYDRSTENR